MIDFTEVAVGTGGSVACSRCHTAPDAVAYSPAAEVVAAIESAVSSWRGAPGPNVSLGGPEPFGHPDLPSIVAAAIGAGVKRLRFETDAVALQSPNNAAGVLSAGVRQIRFTVLGGTPGIHDALSGVPGALDATLAGIRSLRAAAEERAVFVSVSALVPACRHNLRDLPAAVAVAVEAGADSVLIRFEDGGADLAGAIPWLTSACDTGVVNGVWVEVEGAPFCLLPGYDLHLADAVRARPGSKPPLCRRCPLDTACAGGPPGAAADLLASFAPPPFAERLAPAVARAREGGAPHA